MNFEPPPRNQCTGLFAPQIPDTMYCFTDDTFCSAGPSTYSKIEAKAGSKQNPVIYLEEDLNIVQLLKCSNTIAGPISLILQITHQI